MGELKCFYKKRWTMCLAGSYSYWECLGVIRRITAQSLLLHSLWGCLCSGHAVGVLCF